MKKQPAYILADATEWNNWNGCPQEDFPQHDTSETRGAGNTIQI